jgi:hypothetical protein
MQTLSSHTEPAASADGDPAEKSAGDFKLNHADQAIVWPGHATILCEESPPIPLRLGNFVAQMGRTNRPI